jgi:uncharacterized protein (DUF2235 family)
MTRNVVLLSDGTGNSAAKLFKTNVWRTYQALDVSTSNQVAFYDDGVGTSSFKPLAYFGGVFGWGLKRNVIEMYMFLCRNHTCGDRIYGFGFSRGAFTIRVLASFVLSQGLVTKFSSSGDLRRKSLKLYRHFRNREATTHPFGSQAPDRCARCRLSEFIRSIVYRSIHIATDFFDLVASIIHLTNESLRIRHTDSGTRRPLTLLRSILSKLGRFIYSVVSPPSDHSIPTRFISIEFL